MGAHKGYNSKGFVQFMRWQGATPHGTQNIHPLVGSAINQRSRSRQGYRQPLNARKGIKKVVGWIKPAAGLRQFKQKGQGTVGAVFPMIRLGNILQSRVAVA